MKIPLKTPTLTIRGFQEKLDKIDLANLELPDFPDVKCRCKVDEVTNTWQDRVTVQITISKTRAASVVVEIVASASIDRNQIRRQPSFRVSMYAKVCTDKGGYAADSGWQNYFKDYGNGSINWQMGYTEYEINPGTIRKMLTSLVPYVAAVTPIDQATIKSKRNSGPKFKHRGSFGKIGKIGVSIPDGVQDRAITNEEWIAILEARHPNIPIRSLTNDTWVINTGTIKVESTHPLDKPNRNAKMRVIVAAELVKGSAVKGFSCVPNLKLLIDLDNGNITVANPAIREKYHNKAGVLEPVNKDEFLNAVSDRISEG